MLWLLSFDRRIAVNKRNHECTSKKWRIAPCEAILLGKQDRPGTTSRRQLRQTVRQHKPMIDPAAKRLGRRSS
jgi:hypothetical protein